MKTAHTAHKLAPDAYVYTEGAGIYEEFSAIEDTPGYILTYLANELQGKSVLDIGTGSGKYLNALAPHTNSITGIDKSKEQLAIAQKYVELHNNTKLKRATAEHTNEADESYDAILMSWVIENLREPGQQEKVLSETRRVLKKGGACYVIENSGQSEFEEIIKREPDISTVSQTKAWLLQKNFKLVKTIQTYFFFNSIKEAKRVFGLIWGEKIANRIHNQKIKHNVNVYKMVKQ